MENCEETSFLVFLQIQESREELMRKYENNYSPIYHDDVVL